MITTTREIAEITGVDIRTVRNWIKAGKLKGVKIGAHWRVDLNEVVNQSQSGLVLGQPDQGQTVSFTPIAKGDELVYLLAIDGRPKALIDEHEFAMMLVEIQEAIKSGASRATIDIRKRVNSDGQGDEPRTG